MSETIDWEKLWQEHRQYCYSRRDTRYGSDEFLHSSRTEYYRGECDFHKVYYDDKLYYINNKCLYVSDMDGSNIKVLNQSGVYGCIYLHVNVTGIYVYNYEEDDYLIRVIHMDFDGRTISECIEKYINDDYYVKDFYFYDNKLYYILYNYRNKKVIQLRCMDIDAGKIRVLYKKANYMLEHVYANNNIVIFNGTYQNKRHYIIDSGWMMLDFNSNKLECISKPYCSPETILRRPRKYKKSSIFYDKNAQCFKSICFFNMHAGIYWIEVFEGLGELFCDQNEYDNYSNNSPINYLVPIHLWGEKKGQIVEDMPIWKIQKWCRGYSSRYFDGFNYYIAHSYSDFVALSCEGNVERWSDGNNGYGDCAAFKVMGGKYLFLDIDHLGEKRYELSFHKPASLAGSKEDSHADFFETTTKDYSDLKIGKLAQTLFKDMLEAGKATEEEVRLMQQADYSKKTFDLQFPVLVRADDSFYDSKRYYSKPLTIRGVEYMMCSQWFETSANNDRPYLLAWIKKHS